MLLRKFGKTGKMVSILGMGTMRLPIINDDNNQVNETEAIKLIRYAIDNGVNYIDTAYPYHGGASENTVGHALRNGYRERVFLADKLPSWLITKPEDMDRILDEQLEKLQTDYIDYYLIHALNKKYWDNLKLHGIFEFIEKIKTDGRVKHVGFSFHDKYSVFKEIVDDYDWDFCQVQYNYMDEEYQAGKKGIEYAAKKGMGIVVMEPLRGGSLVKRVPDDILEVWDKSEKKRTPAEWALRYLWNHKSISVVLSGMHKIEDVYENVRSAEYADPNSLTKEETDLIYEVRDLYKEKIKVNCTDCKYCMPCPVGVNIPKCFTYLNDASMYGVDATKYVYNMMMHGKSRAENCVECGACEKACPQNIEIIKHLKEVVKTFE